MYLSCWNAIFFADLGKNKRIVARVCPVIFYWPLQTLILPWEQLIASHINDKGKLSFQGYIIIDREAETWTGGSGQE